MAVDQLCLSGKIQQFRKCSVSNSESNLRFMTKRFLYLHSAQYKVINRTTISEKWPRHQYLRDTGERPRWRGSFMVNWCRVKGNQRKIHLESRQPWTIYSTEKTVSYEVNNESQVENYENLKHSKLKTKHIYHLNGTNYFKQETQSVATRDFLIYHQTYHLTSLYHHG